MRTFQRAFRTHTLFKLFAAAILFFSIFALGGCKETIDYADYVSELRSNVFLAEADGFSLRVYAVERETPYLADGSPRETTSRFEAHLIAPSYEKTCTLSFIADGNAYEGEMSYDTVKGEYYFSRTLDVSALQTIACEIRHGERTVSLSAHSVVTDDTLSPKEALYRLCEKEKEFFTAMTDEYGFAGEIYLRLLYEDAPYYYVGVVSKGGKTTAFLLNGKTGKLLAKREG